MLEASRDVSQDIVELCFEGNSYIASASILHVVDVEVYDLQKTFCFVLDGLHNLS